MPTGRRWRSIQAEMRRARAEILGRVSAGEMESRLDDHRHGLHARPYNHRQHCWACLAWCRRQDKENTWASTSTYATGTTRSTPRPPSPPAPGC